MSDNQHISNEIMVLQGMVHELYSKIEEQAGGDVVRPLLPDIQQDGYSNTKRFPFRVFLRSNAEGLDGVEVVADGGELKVYGQGSTYPSETVIGNWVEGGRITITRVYPVVDAFGTVETPGYWYELGPSYKRPAGVDEETGTVINIADTVTVNGVKTIYQRHFGDIAVHDLVACGEAL